MSRCKKRWETVTSAPRAAIPDGNQILIPRTLNQDAAVRRVRSLVRRNRPDGRRSTGTAGRPHWQTKRRATPGPTNGVVDRRQFVLFSHVGAVARLGIGQASRGRWQVPGGSGRHGAPWFNSRTTSPSGLVLFDVDMAIDREFADPVQPRILRGNMRAGKGVVAAKIGDQFGPRRYSASARRRSVSQSDVFGTKLR